MRDATARISLALAKKYDLPCDICGVVHGVTLYRHVAHKEIGWLVENYKIKAIERQKAEIEAATAGQRQKIASLRFKKSSLHTYRELAAIDDEIAKLQAEIEPFKKRKYRLEDLHLEIEISMAKIDELINVPEPSVTDRYKRHE